MSALAPTLEMFLTERLTAQRGASPNTVASYRDTFRLLLRFAAERTRKRPCELDFSDLDAALIGSFLEHLEADRNNSVRTRNNRLSAIHSLFGYSALHHPEHAATIQRVLAIPVKLSDRKTVTYLNDDEVDALLGACDLVTWAGRRDQALLDIAVEAGLRISELASLSCSDVTLGRGANLHVTGKGRKERRVPLGNGAVKVLRAWLPEASGDPAGLIRRAGRRSDLVVLCWQGDPAAGRARVVRGVLAGARPPLLLVSTGLRGEPRERPAAHARVR